MDTKPRQQAQNISQKLRDILIAELEHVPVQHREIVIDYVINGMMLNRNIVKLRRKI